MTVHSFLSVTRLSVVLLILVLLGVCTSCRSVPIQAQAPLPDSRPVALTIDVSSPVSVSKSEYAIGSEDWNYEQLIGADGYGFISRCGDIVGKDDDSEFLFVDGSTVMMTLYGVAVTEHHHPWDLIDSHVAIRQKRQADMGVRTLMDFRLVANQHEAYLVPVSHYTLTSKWVGVVSDVLQRGGCVDAELRNEEVYRNVYRRVRLFEPQRSLPVGRLPSIAALEGKAAALRQVLDDILVPCREGMPESLTEAFRQLDMTYMEWCPAGAPWLRLFAGREIRDRALQPTLYGHQRMTMAEALHQLARSVNTRVIFRDGGIVELADE